MTNLPAALRERLAREAAIELPRIVRRHLSSDGTVRYVLAVGDSANGAKPATIETVFMPEENRQTICISTQAGCAVDCRFCLTATLGLMRNLTAGEIVGQVLVALEDNRAALKPQTNIVLMGQGEPLLNYDAVMAALRILLDPKGVAISPKHATLSTSGIVPGIERLAQEKVRPNLAISLNASSDEQRDQIMPINRKYPLEKLLDACREYPLRPREWLTVRVRAARRIQRFAGRCAARRKAARESARQGESDPVESGRPAATKSPEPQRVAEFQQHPDGQRRARVSSAIRAGRT